MFGFVNKISETLSTWETVKTLAWLGLPLIAFGILLAALAVLAFRHTVKRANSAKDEPEGLLGEIFDSYVDWNAIGPELQSKPRKKLGVLLLMGNKSSLWMGTVTLAFPSALVGIAMVVSSVLPSAVKPTEAKDSPKAAAPVVISAPPVNPRTPQIATPDIPAVPVALPSAPSGIPKSPVRKGPRDLVDPSLLPEDKSDAGVLVQNERRPRPLVPPSLIPSPESDDANGEIRQPNKSSPRPVIRLENSR